MDFVSNDWKAIQRCLIRLYEAYDNDMLIDQEIPMLDALGTAMNELNPNWVEETIEAEQAIKDLIDGIELYDDEDEDWDLDDDD